jgi:surface antigen
MQLASKNRTTRRIAALGVASAALTLAGGCSNAGQGAASGAALGALAGMGLGSLTGDMGKGAAAGAIIGGVGGAVLGDQNERRDRRGSYRSNEW